MTKFTSKPSYRNFVSFRKCIEIFGALKIRRLCNKKTLAKIKNNLKVLKVKIIKSCQLNLKII
jgi:hypothetical protein